MQISKPRRTTYRPLRSADTGSPLFSRSPFVPIAARGSFFLNPPRSFWILSDTSGYFRILSDTFGYLRFYITASYLIKSSERSRHMKIRVSRDDASRQRISSRWLRVRLNAILKMLRSRPSCRGLYQSFSFHDNCLCLSVLTFSLYFYGILIQDSRFQTAIQGTSVLGFYRLFKSDCEQ